MKSSYYYTVLAILFLGIPSGLKAQQEPQYTQYMFNMLSVNPAYAGTSESLNMILLSRLQWVGVAGAPKSHTFAAHTPIKDKRIGLGASIIADNIGPVTNTYINLNYSHRINISESLTLAMGLKAGINNYKVGLLDIKLGETSIVDNAFDQNLTENFKPNFGSGIFLYHQKYYAGISVPKLFKTNLNKGDNSASANEIKQHYFIAGGYIHELNSEWKLKPSVLTKLVNGAPPSADITAQALYQDKYWLGITYRVGDALAFLLNMQINTQIMAGYSYDATISGMNNVSNGSHEIMLSFDFKGFKNDKVKSPRYF